MKMGTEYWADHVAAAKRETVSSSEYAKRRGISVAALYYSQRKLTTPTGTSKDVSTPAKPAHNNPFVALHVLDKVSMHCGSRGLGHQIGTEFLTQMVIEAAKNGLTLPGRELACAPVNLTLGQAYLGAMRAGINCALTNRQILTHLTRKVFAKILPNVNMSLLYDVSHNTCKVEMHKRDGQSKTLYIHRKGATRAYGPGHPDLPPELRAAGQLVLIGGSMGTALYILGGTERGMKLVFRSACHGAGRAMSRHQALKNWSGSKVIDDLAGHGIVIRSPSFRGVAEKAPVVPLISIKG